MGLYKLGNKSWVKVQVFYLEYADCFFQMYNEYISNITDGDNIGHKKK